ncbi:hypothetical protein OKW26_002509 [Paraburkholderia sp. 32]
MPVPVSHRAGIKAHALPSAIQFFGMSAPSGVSFNRAGSANTTTPLQDRRFPESRPARQSAAFLTCSEATSSYRGGETVKTVNLLKVLGIALCVATASSAYAQASDAQAPAATAAAPATTAPSTRAADRKLGRDVRRALGKAPRLQCIERVRAGARRRGDVDRLGASGRHDPAGRRCCERRAGRGLGDQQTHPEPAIPREWRELSTSWTKLSAAPTPPRICTPRCPH